MADHSAEQMKKRYIHWMRSELGTVFHHLVQDVTLLHMKYNEYVDLYGQTEEQIKLLNSAAPGFFWLVEEAWWDDLLLHIARLTDGRSDVLTVRRLPALVRVALRDDLAVLMSVLDDATEFARDRRNRLLAHHNMDLALSRPATPLAPASRESIQMALKAIDDVMHLVEYAYMKTGPTFYDPLRIRGGSHTLIDIVQRGVADRDRHFGLSRIDRTD